MVLTVSETGTLFISARGITRDIDLDPDDESLESELILALSSAGELSVFAERFKSLQGLTISGSTLYAATKGLKKEAKADGVVFQIPILPDGMAGALSQVGPSESFKKPVGLARDRLGALFITTKELQLLEDS